MTKQNTASEKLKLVEDKIRELVPRLKELRSGFQFYVEGMTRVVIWTDGFFVRDQFREEWQIINNPDPHLKIIGHPITLEDVLEALGDNQYVDTHSGKVRIRVGGEDYEYDGKTLSRSVYAYWQYGNPLSGQSRETIDVLYKLLITEDKITAPQYSVTESNINDKND